MNDIETGYPVASVYVDVDIDPDFDRDPFTPLTRLAEEGEVIAGRNGLYHGLAVPNFSKFRDDDRDTFLALSFRAWREVVTDPETFSSAKAHQSSLAKTFGKNLLTMDPPEHGHYKRMVLPAFSHRIVTDELTKVADPIIGACLDRIAGQGRAELISEFTSHYPYLVIAAIFGVPPDLADESALLANLGSTLAKSRDLAAIQAISMRLDAFYQKIVDHHRAHPRDDLTTALIATEVDGRPLTDAEVVSFVKVIVSAGLDTTVRQTASLIWRLLENPEQLADLQANPALLESAIWEGLRIEPATTTTPRIAVRDTEICGVRIPAGSGVYAIKSMANRDRIRWEDPDRFDIRRKRQPIASFGAGIHTCLGANLAVAEMKIAMTGLLARLKNLRKDPDHWPQSYMRGWNLRSPTIVPVLWDVD